MDKSSELQLVGGKSRVSVTWQTVHGWPDKPFTDEEFIKDSFIRLSAVLGLQKQNKEEIIPKIDETSRLARRDHNNGKRHKFQI